MTTTHPGPYRATPAPTTHPVPIRADDPHQTSPCRPTTHPAPAPHHADMPTPAAPTSLPEPPRPDMPHQADPDQPDYPAQSVPHPTLPPDPHPTSRACPTQPPTTSQSEPTPTDVPGRPSPTPAPPDCPSHNLPHRPTPTIHAAPSRSRPTTPPDPSHPDPLPTIRPTPYQPEPTAQTAPAPTPPDAPTRTNPPLPAPTSPPTPAPPHCPARYHHTLGAYRNGCRCPTAREQHRIYYKRRRQHRPYRRLVHPTGTRRRIQALYALGHTAITIGHTAGIRPNIISRLCTGNRPITTHTHNRILNAYNTLRHTPGTSTRTRTRAARNAWPTPTEWDAYGPEWIDTPDPTPDPTLIDDFAIEKVIRHDLPLDTLTGPEQATLYTRLKQQHLTDGQIRHRLDASAAQVSRMARHAAQHTERTAA